MYASMLEAFGFDVVAVGDAAQATALVASRKPDVVVTDLSIPHQDGWTFMRHLQADVETRATPIIVVTGHAEASTRARAFAHGARVFLTKPCDPLVLEKAVRNVLFRPAEPVPLVGASGDMDMRARLRWADGRTTELPVFDVGCVEVLQADETGTHRFLSTTERDAEGYVILNELAPDRDAG